MNELTRSARLLRAAVGAAGPIEPHPADWGHWVNVADHERVIPLLYDLVAHGTASVGAEEIERATRLQMEVMTTLVRFEHDLLEVAAMLDEEGYAFAVLKGAATAHLDYSDPALRQYGDIDLLVAPADFQGVLSLLRESGWLQAYPLPRHHERFTHAITLRNGTRVEIDLHQRVGHRAIGEVISTESLLRDRVQYQVAGRTLWALSRPDRLIHAAVHSVASRGEFRRLSSTADVLVLAEAMSTDAAVVLARAEHFRVRSIVERAIVTAYTDAQLPMNEGWATATQATRASPRSGAWLVKRAYHADRRRPVFEELAFLYVMNGWRARWFYLSGYFATDADYATRKLRSGFVAQTRYLLSRLRSR